MESDEVLSLIQQKMVKQEERNAEYQRIKEREEFITTVLLVAPLFLVSFSTSLWILAHTWKVVFK